MAEVKVQTAEIVLRTVNLTKALFKQLPVLRDWHDVKPFLVGSDVDPSRVVGWVHGSVFGDEWKKWLIVKTGEGMYARYEALDETCRKFKQIYVV